MTPEYPLSVIVWNRLSAQYEFPGLDNSLDNVWLPPVKSLAMTEMVVLLTKRIFSCTESPTGNSTRLVPLRIC